MAAPKKEPIKKEEPKVEVPKVDEVIKYRHDFKSWDEYNAYKGKKG